MTSRLIRPCLLAVLILYLHFLRPSSARRCAPMTVELCKDMKWSKEGTVFPNLRGHSNGEEAGKEMNDFYPLIKTKCSPDIHLFLCSLYAPVCTILDEAIPPCRNLCHSAKRGCVEILEQFGRNWLFDCESFPPEGRPDQICFSNNIQNNFTSRMRNNDNRFADDLNKNKGQPSSSKFNCPVQLQIAPEYQYKIQLGSDQRVDNCAFPCYHNATFFDTREVQTARTWIVSVSIVTFALSLFTLLTFLLDTERLNYPERPMVYISFCFCVVSLLTLIGYFIGDEVSCNRQVYNKTLNFLTEKTIKQGTLHDWRCTLSSMMLYFFIMAGFIWWCVLSLAWFMSTTLKWGQEAIETKSHFFHAVAWTVPSLLTLAVLVARIVDGDVLIGLCFVGTWDTDALMFAIFLPVAFFLSFGSLFSIIGLVSLTDIWKIMRNDGLKTQKLKKLVLKIGLFCFSFIGITAAFLGCLMYRHQNLSEWTASWQDQICRDPAFKKKWQTSCRHPDRPPSEASPDFSLYVCYYLLLPFLGCLPTIWIFSWKTVKTWAGIFQYCGYKPAN